MSEDMLIHFSSNSSNQSDQSLPTKIAKLEARMVGKGPTVVPAQTMRLAVSSTNFGAAAEELEVPMSSSDSDDDVSLCLIYLSVELFFVSYSDDKPCSEFAICESPQILCGQC